MKRRGRLIVNPNPDHFSESKVNNTWKEGEDLLSILIQTTSVLLKLVRGKVSFIYIKTPPPWLGLSFLYTLKPGIFTSSFGILSDNHVSDITRMSKLFWCIKILISSIFSISFVCSNVQFSLLCFVFDYIFQSWCCSVSFVYYLCHYCLFCYHPCKFFY